MDAHQIRQPCLAVSTHPAHLPVAYAVVSFGGFLGMGEEYYPMPWSKLDYDTRLRRSARRACVGHLSPRAYRLDNRKYAGSAKESDSLHSK
jgi:hypothetical protein